MVSESEADVAEAAAEPWPDALPWQRNLRLSFAAGRDRAHHAWLVAGPRGLGKRTLALHLARDLLCESPTADALACGNCDGCRYVAAGTHPDLRLIEPWRIEPDGTRVAVQEIGIDAIRDLTGFTQITSHRRGVRVAIVAPAERLTVEAANALLKTLEEPPAGTILVLVSHLPGRLLATVASRCLRIPAPRPSPAEAIAWLAGQGIATPDLALAYAGGAPLAALRIAADGQSGERAHWFDALARPERLEAIAMGARIDAADKPDRKARLELVLDALAAWTEDLARVAGGGAPRRLPGRADALGALAPRVAGVDLCRYHRSIVHQRAHVARPLNPRLVAESLVDAYRELFAPQPRPSGAAGSRGTGAGGG